MPDYDPSEDVQVHIEFGHDQEEAAQPINPDAPFRIAVLGNFGGKKRGQRALLVDRDSLNQIFQKMKVSVDLPLGGEVPKVYLTFDKVEDFHPDHLLERDPLLKKLQQIQQQLRKSGKLEEVAEELAFIKDSTSSLQEIPPAQEVEASKEGKTEEVAVSQDLFNMILDGGASSSSPQAKPAQKAKAAIDHLVDASLKSHTIKKTTASEKQLLAEIDETIAEQLRAIIHHPLYQSLESLWQSVYFLVRNLETSQRLQIYLIDFSQDELLEDLSQNEDLKDSKIYNLLIREQLGIGEEKPWAVLMGNYEFSKTQREIVGLHKLAQLARIAQAPIFTSGNSSYLHCENLRKTPYPDEWTQVPSLEVVEQWNHLRSSQEASYLALTIPRYMLRYPYGKETFPCDNFDFEELIVEEENENSFDSKYLWGNASVLCVYLLGRAFGEAGWNLGRDLVYHVGGLPHHSYKTELETKFQASGEFLISDNTAKEISKQGLIPILASAYGDTIQMRGFQSLSNRNPKLLGRWGA